MLELHVVLSAEYAQQLSLYIDFRIQMYHPDRKDYEKQRMISNILAMWVYGETPEDIATLPDWVRKPQQDTELLASHYQPGERIDFAKHNTMLKTIFAKATSKYSPGTASLVTLRTLDRSIVNVYKGNITEEEFNSLADKAHFILLDEKEGRKPMISKIIPIKSDSPYYGRV